MNSPKIMKAILAAGAKTTVSEKMTGGSGRTHLHVASMAGRPVSVKTLIDHGANPEEQDINGLEPSHLAAQNGHVDVLKVLMEARANVWKELEVTDPDDAPDDGKKKHSITPMQLAAASGHIPALKYFLDQRPVKAAGLKAMAVDLGRTHGDDWQAKFEAALDLEVRQDSEERMNAIPEEVRRTHMEQLQKIMGSLSPKEQKAYMERMAQQMKEESIKKVAEKKKVRVTKPIADL
mmetsp:Transcript_75181/g.152588  ORF Transcript_75181/g.152588 Transcript_75181/m.152588 type:complete len:235 (-) Transcript_75181:61-765(-)